MKTRINFLCAASTVAAGLAMLSAPVLAQDMASSNDSSSDEIVVTARRVAEDLQSVPVSITVVGDAQLRDQKITAVEDIQFVSPSLTTSASLNRSTVNYNIRGQTQQSQGSLASVQPYLNDVPLSVGTFQLYDLESVQVLKGPQGTLFGRNTTGGAVLFTSRKPGNEFDGYLQGSLGNLRARSIQGAVNIPIVQDVLSLRIAGDLTRRRGYTKDLTTGRDLDNQHVDSWRASLRFQPTDFIDNMLVIDSVKVDQNGGGPILVGFLPGLAAGNFPGYPAAFALQQQLGPRQRFSNIDLFDKRRGWGIQDTLSVDLGDVTLRNIAGYRRNRNNAAYDQDGTGLGVIETTSNYLDFNQVDNRTISEEFQIIGNTGRFDWIVGAYYDNTKSVRPESSVSQSFGTISRAVLTEQNDNTKALFAQTDIGADEILPGLTATLGFRYSWDKRQLSSQTINLLTTPGTPGPKLTDIARFSAPTWTVGLNWQADKDLLLYVVSRRGYKTGGFNTLSAIAGPQQRFKPEYITDVEAGVKYEWDASGMRGRINLSAFNGNYSNIQRSVIVAATTSATINAAKATIRGFELEAMISPVEGLDISGYWSVLDAKYDRYINPFSGRDLSDARFPFSPKTKASATVKYTVPTSSNVGEVSLSGTVYHQTSVAYSDDNINFAPAFGAGYTIANFAINVDRVGGTPLDFSLHLKNAFDKEYVSGGGVINSGIFGFGSLYFGEPRTFGATLRYAFGASAK